MGEVLEIDVRSLIPTAKEPGLLPGRHCVNKRAPETVSPCPDSGQPLHLTKLPISLLCRMKVAHFHGLLGGFKRETA